MNIDCVNETNIISENKNTLLKIPIVYGSVAYWLGKKAENNFSHKWCVYLRGNEPTDDISQYIDKVTFVLHNSFNNYIRTVSSPPYVVFELGWGEFDIKIQISLKDPNLKSMEVVHFLKLFPFSHHNTQTTKKPVISEQYDEIIIVNPKKEYFDIDNKFENNNYMYKNSEENITKTDIKNINDQDSQYNKEEEASINLSNKQSQAEFTENNLANKDIKEEITADNDNKEYTAFKKNIDKNLSYIHNLESNFAPLCDENHYKQIQDINNFVYKEISKYKSLLYENDIQINNIKKSIKDAVFTNN